MDKNVIRRYIRNIRRSMSGFDVESKSRAVFERIMELGTCFFGDSVFIYVSFDNEVDTNPIIDHFISKGIMVSVPVVIPDVRIEAVRIGSSGCRMKRCRLGIPEPEEGDLVACEDISTAIVPGIAFDRNLGRIGFGKGYYDNFLAGTKAKKVALAYDFQIVEDFDTDEWDVPMDCIITDKEIIRPKGKTEEARIR